MADDERQVIGLFTREPVTPEPVAANEPTEAMGDADTIETLAMAMDMARSGDVTGCIVILGLNLSEKDKSLVTDTTQLMGLNAADNVTLFLGALEQAKHDLIELRKDQYDGED